MLMEQETIRIWFFSPDSGFSQIITRALGPRYEVRCSKELSLQDSADFLPWCDVLLLDLRRPEGDGENHWENALRFLDEVRQQEMPSPGAVILKDEGRAATLQMMEHGAYDTIASPPDIVELRIVLERAHKHRQVERELHQLRAQERSTGGLSEFVGSAECLREVFEMARKIAPCDVSVLITGETGTGKELLARAIHRLSSRASGPFVAFSCANLPETLVEDELFGHEKGAFTGAVMQRRGRLEAADRGTVFLDEIGDLTLSLQPKLLRVLQERAFERLGSNTLRAVDLRVICATHQNLAEMVHQSKFREDLYYRLNVVQLHLPPLRERRDDIPLLAQHFLERFTQQFGKVARRFSRLALQALEEYNWPGNVRELENVIQRAVVLAESRAIETWHLPINFRSASGQPPVVASYEEEVREFKRRLLLRTLRQCGWRKAETARVLGLARNYLHRLIHQLQIRPEEDEGVVKLVEEQPPATDRVM
jgi:DNA-binding NtrC family response regulator